MERIAVYAGTRNVYEDIGTAIKSMIKNGNIDGIVIMAEDDNLPFRLPEEVEVVNVTPWKHLVEKSVNYDNPWTYMILLRVAYAKILPYDKVVSFDIDTVINKDISELWDIDMTGYYFGGAKEIEKTASTGHLYINAGVLMMNLKELREYGMCDRLLEAINTNFYKFCEQDCINDMCRGHILEIDSTYNRAIALTMPSQNPKVFHFAGHKDWREYHEIERYRQMSWRDVRK